MTANVVALVKLTVLEDVIAPVFDLINSTVGIEEKLVPVIFIVVALAGAMVCETFATVGLVSAAAAKDKLPDPSVFKKNPFVIDCGKVKV